MSAFACDTWCGSGGSKVIIPGFHVEEVNVKTWYGEL